MKRRHSYSAIICRLLLPAFLLLASCSTTKTLTEGQLRLAGTKITVTNDKKFNTVQLNPYLRQQSGAWSPFIYVYNWENGKGKGWDKFVHKLGIAPVIYDSTLVGSSIENLKEHLQYLGYYDSQVDTSTIRGKNPKNVKVNYYVRLGKRYPIRHTLRNTEGRFFPQRVFCRHQRISAQEGLSAQRKTPGRRNRAQRAPPSRFGLLRFY